jgi:hypothetical protein
VKAVPSPGSGYGEKLTVKLNAQQFNLKWKRKIFDLEEH